MAGNDQLGQAPGAGYIMAESQRAPYLSQPQQAAQPPPSVQTPAAVQFQTGHFDVIAHIVGILPTDLKQDVALEFALNLRLCYPRFDRERFLTQCGIDPAIPERSLGVVPAMAWKEVLNFCPCGERHRVLKALKGRFDDYRTREFTVPDLFEAGLGEYEAHWAINNLVMQCNDPETKRRLRLLSADCAAHMARHSDLDATGRACIETARRVARGGVGNLRETQMAAVPAYGGPSLARAQARMCCYDPPQPGYYGGDPDFYRARMIARFSDHEPEDIPIP